jgi:hypothetical protein
MGDNGTFTISASQAVPVALAVKAPEVTMVRRFVFELGLDRYNDPEFYRKLRQGGVLESP